MRQHLTDAVRPRSQRGDKLSRRRLGRRHRSRAVKETVAAQGLKMPALAMPVRVLVMGTRADPVARRSAARSFLRKKVVLERLEERPTG